MKEYHTEDKILEAMHKMEELGVNTMLPLADPYIIRILQHYRANGGKMNFIFQTYAPMMLNREIAEISIRQMQSVDPIGAYISGTYTDVRYETGRVNEITDMISFFRNFDMKLGIGTRCRVSKLNKFSYFPILCNPSNFTAHKLQCTFIRLNATVV